MHWFFDYPWGPALTWLVVFAVLAVLGVSFWSIRKEIRSGWGMSVIGLRLLALGIVLFLLLQPQTKRVISTVLQSSTGVLLDTSKSMSITDAGKTRTRLEIARSILGPKGNDLIAKLHKKGKVRLFQFSTLLEDLPAKELAGIDKATGDSTALGSAIADSVDRFGAEELTSLVVLTDGRDNAGRPASEVAKSLSVPVFVVGVGEVSAEPEGEQKDYAVDNVMADKRVMVNHKTDVQVSISGMGFPNRQVPIELVLNGKVIAKAIKPLGPKRPKAETILAYTPTIPGKYKYAVRIPVEEDELDEQNNERTFTVRVIDPVNRVLYLEVSPRWEYKFLNRVLNANRNIDLLSYVRMTARMLLIQGGLKSAPGAAAPLDEGRLEEFKVVIIGDVGRKFFTDGQVARLAQFVENGGSLVLLGGKNSFGASGFSNTPLGGVLPIAASVMDRYVEVKHAVTTTPEGAAHPIFQRIQLDWSLAPALNTLITTGSLKAGATAMLTTADERSPVVVVQRYGQGKSVVVLTDSTWRWKLGQTRTKLPIDLHQLFWNSLVEWLLPEETETKRPNAVELITDKDEYELNQQVRLIVTVTDADGNLDKNAAVRCEVQTPDDKSLTLEARLGDISAYSASSGEGYVTNFTPHKSGKYAITAVGETGGEEVGREELSIIVGDPALEFRNPDINEELLREIAARSGGKYYRPERAATLLDDIVWQEKIVEKTEREEVWNEWWVLIVFVILMASEWIVRKNRQLA